VSNYSKNLKQNNDIVIYTIKGFEMSTTFLKIKVWQISSIKMLALNFTMFFIAGFSAFSQSPEIIIDGSTFIGPNSSCSASLDLLSEEKGLLINRVNLTSTTDKSTVPLLCHTMLVYNLNTQSDITPGFYWWDALAAIPHWVSLSSGSGAGPEPWLLTGNSNSFTDYTDNLLGTLTGTTMPLNFIVNGQRAGRIELNPNTANTFFGYKSGNVNTGINNTATGYLALTTNSNGNFNTAIGNSALQSNVAGSWNTAVGNIALQMNRTGNDNTALGDETLSNNTTGSNNTATGGGSLLANTVGNQNTANGNLALRFNTTGSNNVASGYKSLFENTTGGANTAYGNFALMNNIGSQNTATGTNALNANTSGGNNTATGINAMKGNLTGSQNTATGEAALLANNANYNTATGAHSLYENTSGNNNTADGVASLQNNITGSRNSAVGSFALFNNKGDANIGIGSNSGTAVTTGNNIITIGSGLPGVNTSNTTYMANIWGTSVVAGINGGGQDVLQVVVNSDGQLGTVSTSGGGSDTTDWKLLGNANTTEGTNFLGTTDAKYLDFRVNNLRSGHIDWDGSKANTFFGFSAGISNTGEYNTATGYLALTTNTTGFQNTATGYLALTSNSTGSGNTATGIYTLNYNTTGNANTATGIFSLINNTTGSYNTATGYGSLGYNTTGSNNIGIGSNSGLNVLTASNVITIGSGLSGVNTSNTTYMANIWGTSVVAGINGGGQDVLQVVVNSDGQLGTIKTSGNVSDTTDWKLLGNANTTEGTNFLGTTDQKYLDFRVNNLRSGHIDWDNTKANTFFGYSAGLSNTGRYNTATGYLALLSNTTGSWNTAVGNSALQINTNGGANTALGHGALASNTSGGNNTATGSVSLITNTTGSHNTATGLSALYSNSEGDGNAATGSAALYNNTVGDGNTALGILSLYYNTIGSNNIGIGSNSGQNISTASNVITIGSGLSGVNTSNTTFMANIWGTSVVAGINGGGPAVLQVVVNSDGQLGTVSVSGNVSDTTDWKLLGNANTTEGQHFLGTKDAKYLDFRVNNIMSGHIDWDNNKANTFFGFSAGLSNTGINNTATGYLSLTSNSTGYNNTAIGNSALQSNITGYNNTATGYLALNKNTTGGWNTANGNLALNKNTTGGNNTATGVHSLRSTTSGTNNTAYGVASLEFNITGNNNSAVGLNSLINSKGDNNIGIGYQSGSAVTTANNMICIGSNIAGDNIGNHTYISNIHSTTVTGTAAAPVLSVVVNSDGLLGTIPTPGTGTDANWKLLGNANTVEGQDFLGTTDGKYLDFRVANQRSGHIDWDYNKANTFFGYRAGIANTGANNTVTGYLALTTNSTGYGITATGTQSLYSNTTGNDNTATGYVSLYHNTTGTGNTADGGGALFSNTGNKNTAVGFYALGSSKGNDNIGIGYFSGTAVTSASNMICIGSNIAGDNVGNHTYIANIHGTTVAGTTAGGPALSVVVNSDGLLGTKTTSFVFTHYIGEEFECGVIFYLFRDASGTEHGLIVSPTDVSTGSVWSDPVNTTGATSPWDGSGTNPGNSYKIQQNTTSSAAEECMGYSTSSCSSDWYLPSMDELSLLFDASYIVNRTLGSSGQLANAYYWSSTEKSSTDAIVRGFGTMGGIPGSEKKDFTHYVRAIRAF